MGTSTTGLFNGFLRRIPHRVRVCSHKTAFGGVGGNVQRLIVITFLLNGQFFLPVFLPFVERVGLEKADLFWLEEAFCFSMFIHTLPASVLSDRWGRKPAIIIGCVTWTLGLLVYALGQQFWHFLCADWLIGAGVACIVCSVDALLYESLPGVKGKFFSRRILGNQNCYALIAQATVSICGGFLALVSLPLTMWLSVVCIGSSTIVALFLREPKRQELQATHSDWGSVGRLFSGSSTFRLVVVVFSVITTLFMSMNWLCQLYQKELKISLEGFGAMHAAAVLGSALCSRMTHRMAPLMNDRVLLLSIAGIVIASFIGLGFTLSLWGLVLFFIGRSMWGAMTTLSSDMIVRIAPEGSRSTALSLRHLLTRAIFCVACPLLAMLVDAVSICQATLIIGVVGLLLLLLSLLCLRFCRGNLAG